MRFWYGNEPVFLPADYRLRIARNADGTYRCTVDPSSGKVIDLHEALIRVAFDTSTSRPELRTSIPKRE